MRDQQDLQKKLEAILGSENVYFQPPASFKLHYPCIVYSISDRNTLKANDGHYIIYNRYEIMHIFKKLENEKVNDILEAFRGDNISAERRQIIDGLYHDYYTLFY